MILKQTRSMKKTRCKKNFFWIKLFSNKAQDVYINIWNFTIDRKLRLINEIAWRHVCVSTSPPPPPSYRFHERSGFRRLSSSLRYDDGVIMDGPFLTSTLSNSKMFSCIFKPCYTVNNMWGRFGHNCLNVNDTKMILQLFKIYVLLWLL